MIDVRKSPELLGVILTLKRSTTAARREMRKAAREELNAQWKPLLQQHAQTRLQHAVIVKGARSKVGSDSFEMLAATSRRALSGGLIPESQWQGAEYGSNTHNQFGPRNARGTVAKAAAREAGPRIVAAWVSGLVKGLTQANPHMETTSGN